jgi:protein involved in polysaccharide export with SLBB domain
MRKTLPLIVLAIAGFGLLSAAAIRAQQAANQGQQELNAKRCVAVFGAVRSPARFEIQSALRLADAIALAGGPAWEGETFIQLVNAGASQKCYQSETGPLTTSAMSRHGEILPWSMTYNLASLRRDDERTNPFLREGDIVMLLKGPLVYVTGGVVAPQAMSLTDGMTLTRAIALAGGPTHDARIKKVHIYRRKDELIGQLDILMDVTAIRKGHAKDPALQPFDVVDVSRKGSW